MGDQLTTDDRTVADVLIGNRAVVTLGQSTTAKFTTVSDEQTTVQVKKGLVRVAAAASALGEQGMVTVQTPTGQVQTRGGIVRVLVDQLTGAAAQTPIGEARPYQASYSSSTMIAAVTPRNEIIQVEEGSAEIAGAEGKAVTVQTGQSITLQAGQAGPISKLVNQAGMRAGILASAGHSQTPKEGRDHLVALQVEQATALGTTLTGAAETGKGEVARKDHLKNVINGATGGVLLNSGSLVSSLFGEGSAANPTSGGITTDRSGAGYGGLNSNGFTVIPSDSIVVKRNGSNALLVFTRKDPLSYKLEELPPITSEFLVREELALVGGSGNLGHNGEAPTTTLVVRGAASPTVTGFMNTASTVEGGFDGSQANGLFPSATLPEPFTNSEVPKRVVNANSMFVVQEAPPSEFSFTGGTLSQFSNQKNGVFRATNFQGSTTGHGQSFVDGAITSTGTNDVLTGGVTLDQGTKATIGTTDATNIYYNADAARKSTLQNLGAPFTGSLLSVINGPNNDVTTSVTVQDRLLGVYDGSTIDTEGGNKALLSVLDAKLKGPTGSIPLVDIAAGSHFDREGAMTPGSAPDVKVTSAVVVRSTPSTIPLDGALLEASAPLFALTKATMTTTSHFADLAGNKAQSMLLNDSLVALDASTLTIKGNLLNLRAATATVNNGYLFSLNNGSTLTLDGGALFSLTGESSLNLLNANAFGVFGGGANILTINNDLCTATCFQLVNSANQLLFSPDGTPLLVAGEGLTHNVMLPNDFKVFALAPGAPVPDVSIGENAALFHIDGTSTLTINGATVVAP